MVEMDISSQLSVSVVLGSIARVTLKIKLVMLRQRIGPKIRCCQKKLAGCESDVIYIDALSYVDL